MGSHDQFRGIPAVVHLSSSGFEVFELPEYRNKILGSRDVEVRLFSVLDK